MYITYEEIITVNHNPMYWQLDHYNRICYYEIDRDIFRSRTGHARFERARMFEFTASDVRQRFERDIASLVQLPTLVVGELAEAFPVRAQGETPARFTRLSSIDIPGNSRIVYFQYHHLDSRITSEEVFGSGLFNVYLNESNRTHWAVKEGNLIEILADLRERQANNTRPRFFEVDKWPLPKLRHVAVMMPFATEFNSVYESVKSACRQVGYQSLRVDEVYGPSKIVNDIFAAIVQSQLVICDLTGKNPNVLYEAGIAHANNIEVITLGQNGDDIPFDLRQFRYITYFPNTEGLAKLENDLVRSIRTCLGR